MPSARQKLQMKLRGLQQLPEEQQESESGSDLESPRNEILKTHKKKKKKNGTRSTVYSKIDGKEERSSSSRNCLYTLLCCCMDNDIFKKANASGIPGGVAEGDVIFEQTLKDGRTKWENRYVRLIDHTLMVYESETGRIF